MRIAWCARWFAVAALSMPAFAGCNRPHKEPKAGAWEAAYGHPTRGYVGDKGNSFDGPLRGQYGSFDPGQRIHPESAPIDPSCRVHSVLQNLIAQADANPETLLVTFRDTVDTPAFPIPNVDSSRTTSSNMARLAQADSLIMEIRARRGAQAMEDTTFLVSLGARVLESYWLIEGFQIALPLSVGKVDSLLANPSLRRIEPRSIRVDPPTCTVNAPASANATDVIAGRKEIGADLYSSPAAGFSWIGMLDTGVRKDHKLLSGSPAHLDAVKDCVNGGSNCTGSKPQDEEEGHGTSTAGILSAFAVPDNRLRGVTQSTVDSYKVYYTRGHRWYLDVCATVRAFQLAISRLNRVVVVEIQDPDPATCASLGGIDDAADRAFDAGVVVVAAVGNYGTGCATSPSGGPCAVVTTTSSPSQISRVAAARRVLAIGSYDLQYKCCESSQSWNATADGRFKPDLQLPTNTRTAGNEGSTPSEDDCALRSHTGTSGATAYAGGALALLRNLAPTYDAGQIYALAILSGQEVGPFARGEKGAGRLKLPWNDNLAYDKVSLNTGEYYDLTIDVPATGLSNFRAAIWWPEYAKTVSGALVNTHNNIDLLLLDRTGTTVKSSTSVDGVFERLSVASITNGPCKLRIRATTIRNGPQTVYCSVAYKR